jgi:protein SCO1/2
MIKMSRRAWLGMAGAAAAVGAVGLPPLQRESRAAAPLPPRELIQRRNFPNVVLTTHEGEQVRFYDDLVKDKFVTLNMMFTACKAICPLTTANLVRVQKLLGERVGRDLFMYSITLDPKQDTPEVLNEYAKTFGVGPGWKFLTGKPEDVERLRRSLGFSWANREMDEDKDFHTGNVRYGNEPLMLWGAVPGMAEPEWVSECVLFADWPQNREKDRQLIAQAKALRVQSPAGHTQPNVPTAHDHGKH